MATDGENGGNTEGRDAKGHFFSGNLVRSGSGHTPCIVLPFASGGPSRGDTGCGGETPPCRLGPHRRAPQETPGRLHGTARRRLADGTSRPWLAGLSAEIRGVAVRS